MTYREYKSTTPKYKVTLKDADGVTINPMTAFLKVIIRVYNIWSNDILINYSNESPLPDEYYSPILSSTEIKWVIPKAISALAETGENRVEIWLFKTDSEIPVDQESKQCIHATLNEFIDSRPGYESETTTSIPTTTVLPTTTVAPTTSIGPTTTEASTTSGATTTLGPTTTSGPTTTGAPVIFVEANIEDATPDQIFVIFSEEIDPTSEPDPSALEPSGSWVVTAIDISGTLVTLTVDVPYVNADGNQLLDYIKPVLNMLKSNISGIEVESFSDALVTNNILP